MLSILCGSNKKLNEDKIKSTDNLPLKPLSETAKGKQKDNGNQELGNESNNEQEASQTRDWDKEPWTGSDTVKINEFIQGIRDIRLKEKQEKEAEEAKNLPAPKEWPMPEPKVTWRKTAEFNLGKSDSDSDSISDSE